MNKKLVLEVDDIVKEIMEECEDYAISKDIEYVDIEDNVEKVLKSKFSRYLKLKNDPPDVREAKEELFDWNMRFLKIDNACDSLKELSLKSWGDFKARHGIKLILEKFLP